MEDVEFRQKLQRYKDTVYRIAYTYLRNQADAEDVSQDTFLKLYLREVPFPDDGAGLGEYGLTPAASRRFRFVQSGIRTVRRCRQISQSV